ncbi:Lurp-one-related [Thalictrum thalictroides]|uniref:Lurp-one-related n=1 Tax=Thalictrum thalictroides TaxID=46969 RepID=A0A7J6V7X3_THATH|nr:Lurp-one-related [Thalictrum thalictroides]
MRKVMTITDGNLAVSDVNGNILFKVKGSFFTLHDKRVLLDAAGNPLLSMHQKMLSAHRRWEVYRGESSDLLFSVKKSSMLQVRTSLDVFHASNTSEDVCDFKIKGSWFERSCIVYLGDSTNIVAQMHKKHSVQSIVLGKDTFMVTVYPHVDHAFIVALIVILNEINEDRNDMD